MKNFNKLILCGIFGDIIGKHFEFLRIPNKTKDFELFNEDSTYTDDTMCTLAVMKWLNGDTKQSLADIMRETCNAEPYRGYGGMFRKWLRDENMTAYSSFGNGAGMKSSPVGWYARSEEECLELAKQTAIITHNHPEGIKGAQAIALSVFMAKNSESKDNIKKRISELFHYDLDRTLDEIRPTYKFDVTCQGSVPEAIIAFLESTDIEDAVRNAVSLGGDTDTQGIMAGAIAEAYYKDYGDSIIYDETLKRLPQRHIETIKEFNNKIKNTYEEDEYFE